HADGFRDQPACRPRPVAVGGGLSHGDAPEVRRPAGAGAPLWRSDGSGYTVTLSVRAIDSVARPFFAGEVSGVDITQPLSHADAAAISAGMDHYGVLVFHDQPFTDDTQLAFSRNFGALEQATGDIAQGSERRLSMDVNDISNLNKDNEILARDDRRRLF